MAGSDPEPAAKTRPPHAWKLTVLLDRQSLDWQRGTRPLVESYLTGARELGEDAETVLNLIYHEVLLRRRLDAESPTLAEYVARFPHLAHQLAVQFALDEVLPAEPTEHDDDVPPARLDGVCVPGYEILEVLGRGGMGIVYRARHLALNRTVALKMILDGAHSGPRQATRFRTEAELIARLQHPNIVRIHEVGEHDGRPYLALEFVDGGTLDRLLAGHPRPLEQAVELVEMLAIAVEHAHGRGVIHRDLKPANVLMTRDGHPRIGDFGLAKLIAGDSRQTESGALVGTPSYMAPEQVDGTPAQIGPTTDIYALGAILYETLTGRPPFRAESPVATMLQVRTAELVPPRRLRPGLPRDLETICLKSLERDPRRRYASAGDLADDLRRYREGRPIVARPVPAWERLWLWTRRQRALAAVVLLGIASAAALAIEGVAYSLQLGQLNKQLSASNAELADARTAAERNARDALAAISDMLVRVADKDLSGVSEAEPVRRDLLKQALARLESLLARNPTDPEVRHEIGKAHLATAAIHKALGEYSQAIEQCRKALAILEPLVSPQAGNGLFDSLASVHGSLAELLPPEEGREHFLRAEEILKRLAGDDRRFLASLARLYYGVAGRKEGFGVASIDDYHRQAIAILEPLAQRDPQTFNRDVARAVHNLGLHQGKVGRGDESAASLRRALAIWEAMSPERRTEDDELGIVACQNALAFDLQERGSPEAAREAEAMLRNAVQSSERLALRHPGRLVQRDALARAWSNLGSFHFRAQRYEQAIAPYLKAVEETESIVRDFPEARGQRILMAHNLQDLATAQAGLGKAEEARVGFDRALTIVEPLLRESPEDFHLLQCLATILLNQGNLVRAADGPSAALPIRRRCVEAYERTRRVSPDDAYVLTCLNGARGNLSATLQELGHVDEALKQLEQMIVDAPPEARVGLKLQRALVLARGGRHREAIEESSALEREPGLNAESLYNLACVHAQAVKAVTSDPGLDPSRKLERIGTSTAAALTLIERSYRDGKFPRESLLGLLREDHDLDPIREDPRFQALLKAVSR